MLQKWKNRKEKEKTTEHATENAPKCSPWRPPAFPRSSPGLPPAFGGILELISAHHAHSGPILQFRNIFLFF